jgi:hypothetical protein
MAFATFRSAGDPVRPTVAGTRVVSTQIGRTGTQFPRLGCHDDVSFCSRINLGDEEWGERATHLDVRNVDAKCYLGSGLMKTLTGIVVVFSIVLSADE